MRQSKLLASVGFAVACAVSATAIAAEPDQTPREGIILKVSDGEIIVDLGGSDGLPDDATVRVYRRVEVTHPVTEKTIVDRFPIGDLPLRQVGDQLSIANKAESLERLPAVGDYVVWFPPKQSPAQAQKAKPPAASPKETTDPSDSKTVDLTSDVPSKSSEPCPPTQSPEVAAVDKAFQKSLGRPLSERVDIWTAFLEEHPDSPFAEQVAAELKWLRGRLLEQRALIMQREDDKRNPLEAKVTYAPTLYPGDPVELVATFEEPERVEKVRVLYRHPDEPSFQERDLERDGDRNWRTRLDEHAEAPGEFEFFVEAVRDDGELQLIAGSASEPNDLHVEVPPNDPIRRADRSKATGVVEYVNFKSGPGDDEYLRFESDYRYHVGFGMLEALKVGAGIFEGRGGPVDEIEAGADASDISVSYGFAELQFTLSEFVGLSGRLLVGDRQSSSSSSLDDTFGLRTELRIGRRDATRLELGLANTDGIGNEVWIKLAVEELENIPMSGEVVVTNLPVGEDLGVMLNYGTGYQFNDWFTLMARVGWNARTIQYQGPTAGLGTVFTW
ncbi:hypothetical protein FIV42_24475 [Persicimonas caeni]|uniref:Uncharacterized protein n=1 Tax=Persicimonas caeni TaxID=2292766 RepID=A0A4Y6PZT3_PERCE|nr:hypothetical protein [Persicimonas caeni]QDG53782.1 hypothetical protein FIV42_24475 [Persicimonas caeni]QED35003.1 hypothetical protein FRD00_24470 [Persicimonas caeni]